MGAALEREAARRRRRAQAAAATPRALSSPTALADGVGAYFGQHAETSLGYCMSRTAVVAAGAADGGGGGGALFPTAILGVAVVDGGLGVATHGTFCVTCSDESKVRLKYIILRF